MNLYFYADKASRKTDTQMMTFTAFVGNQKTNTFFERLGRNFDGLVGTLILVLAITVYDAWNSN